MIVSQKNIVVLSETFDSKDVELNFRIPLVIQKSKIIILCNMLRIHE